MTLCEANIRIGELIRDCAFQMADAVKAGDDVSELKVYRAGLVFAADAASVFLTRGQDQAYFERHMRLMIDELGVSQTFRSGMIAALKATEEEGACHGW